MKKGSPPIVFTVRAERALFTRHDLRVERFTYPVPTFGALAGVLRSIYAKPAFYWVPTRALYFEPHSIPEYTGKRGKRCDHHTASIHCSRSASSENADISLYDVHYVVESAL